MSDLTRCNYCSLQNMKETARERGVGLTVQLETQGEMRGWFSARYSDEREPSAWFMQLTGKCAC